MSLPRRFTFGVDVISLLAGRITLFINGPFFRAFRVLDCALLLGGISIFSAVFLVCKYLFVFSFVGQIRTGSPDKVTGDYRDWPDKDVGSVCMKKKNISTHFFLKSWDVDPMTGV